MKGDAVARPEFHEELGRRVAQARREQDVTQEQLALLSGVSLRLIGQLENGKATGIGLEKLLSILNTIGLDLDVVPIGPGVRSQADIEYEEMAMKAISQWL
jgi:transcriptional regulator with XRE-family HTH domain